MAWRKRKTFLKKWRRGGSWYRVTLKDGTFFTKCIGVWEVPIGADKLLRDYFDVRDKDSTEIS